MIFRKNNEIAGLKRQEVLKLFVEKTKETMRFGTFKNLLIKVAELDKRYKNMICSVCHNTHFDLISDHVTIFSPSCKHDVCATCLGTIINIDEKVKLVLTLNNLSYIKLYPQISVHYLARIMTPKKEK